MAEILDCTNARPRWDVHPSLWGAGSWIVHFDRERAQLAVWAPPGTPIFSETGLGVACWRHATWRDEERAFAGAPPDTFEEVSSFTACAALPSDFHAWAAQETAAHADRLRGFALRHPRATEVALAHSCLAEELHEAFPADLTRRFADAEAAAEPAAPEPGRLHAAPPRRPMGSELTDVVSLRGMRRGELGHFAIQLAFVAMLYAAYRIAVRGPFAASGPDFDIVGVLREPVYSALFGLYGTGHVLLTAGFLLWVYFRRHQAFSFVRNALVLAAALTIAGYLALSLWPAAVYDEGAEHAIPAIAVPSMPALHLAVALVLGYCGAALVRSRTACLLWLSYPMLVATVVIVNPPNWVLLTLLAAVTLACGGWYLARKAGPKVKSEWRPPAYLALTPRALARRLLPGLLSQSHP